MPLTCIRKPFTKQENISCLHPEVRKWFTTKFKDLTPPQRYSFKLISRDKNVVITAPTGSGKTFSAFMIILSKLFALERKGKLEDKVYCVYISPLRALDNDVYKNLLVPLEDMGKAKKVRVAIRTGDVSSYEKQKQLRKPPHILITTPESLAIVLNSRRFVEKLDAVKWVIVDEIHELASNKRGVHLSLSIERLREFLGRDFVRIGLGATLHPLKEAAKFLVGYEGDKLRDCRIVDVSWFKPFDLKLLCPASDIIHTSSERMNAMMYKLLNRIINQHRTTLVFTNTRSGTERVVHHLKSSGNYRAESIAAHHGSLSRDLRWEVEERLKRGLLKAVISSTSLELGIDIGNIDVVAQIGSPKSVTRCVQRIGRSGHGLLDTAKGRIIGMDRDDLVECAVMLKCANKRVLDQMDVPKNCLDVLVQHIVGMGLQRRWEVDEALALIRNSYCYHELAKETFINLLHYVAGHYASLEDRRVYGKIWFDPEEGRIGRRGKYTKVIYYLNLGTIPDETKVRVYTRRPRNYVGSIEEGFLERLKRGDVFVLGGTTYEFRYARGMRCYVDKREGFLPTIPAWFSELLPLSYDLALKIGKFRERMYQSLRRGDKKRMKKLVSELSADQRTREAILQYFKVQYEYLGKVPTAHRLLIEDTRDLRGRRIVVFHALYGRRVNDALSRVFAFIIGKMIRSDIGVVVSDNGYALILPEKEFSMREVFRRAMTTDIRELLRANVRRTELMRRRFRHCSTRGFLVLRNYKGHKISVRKQQLNSQTLLNVCERIDPEFPIIQETYREILEDTMDLARAKGIMERVREKKIKWELLKTSVPSPFAHNLIVLGEADIIRMKERKERLLELHRKIMEKLNATG